MIKILFLAANPQDTQALQLDEEVRAIDLALRQGEFREKFDLHQHWSVRVSDLQELLLRHQPDIVHFSGHGGARGEIILQADAHTGQTVSPEALGELFGILEGSVRCVVLNACYSEAQAQSIAQHVDCVVGMSDAISDQAARNFSAAFYGALAYARSVFTAFSLACNRINLVDLPEHQVPRLLSPRENPREIRLIDEQDATNDSAPEGHVVHGDLVGEDKVEGDKFVLGDVEGMAAIGGGVVQIEGNVYIGTAASPEDAAKDDEPAAGVPPYQGLRYFDIDDAHLFFGRERLTAELVAYMHDHRFLAVIGASGSGKSSLVRAGLVPALQGGQRLPDGTLLPDGSTRWPIHVITPKAHPLEQLAGSLTLSSESVTAQATFMDDLARDDRSLHLYATRLVAQQNVERLLLIVDQFEELFTLCRSTAERDAFVGNLLTACKDDGVVSVIIALRADFYHRCADHEQLRMTLQNNQRYIGPMSSEDLRRAIEEPARQFGWELEPGLVDLFLDDVADESGALPLLSHALLETWRRRQGRMMTLAGYAASGRVQGAIAQTAEMVYRQRLSAEEQPIAREIFLRLTELGEGVQDTRRRVALDELIPHDERAAQVEKVLKTLTDARLVTTDREAGSSQEEAEVAHEALIREWNTLQMWLQDDREGLRIHRHLTESAEAWELMSRDPGELYRGTRLDQAEEWVEKHLNELNAQEREFFDASQEERARRQEERARNVREREETRQRELEQAQRLAQEADMRTQAQSRATNRMRWLAMSLLVLLAMALGGSLWIRQQSLTLAERNLALRQQTENAEYEKRRARASELATLAQITMDSDLPDMSVALNLAYEAVTTTLETDGYIVPNASAALVDAVVRAPPWILTISTRDANEGSKELEPVSHLSVGGYAEFSPDGRYILGTTSGNAVIIWDSYTGNRIQSLRIV